MEEVFLGEVSQEVSQEPWCITATVDNRKIDFKVDTGADVTVIPFSLCDAHQMKRLQAPDKKSHGPEELL